MGTVKKLIGLGVITGVVAFAYLRTLGNKVNAELPGEEKEVPQLV